MSQAIRHQFFIFSVSAGTPGSQIAAFTTLAGLESSEPVSCKGLVNKVVEIAGDASDLAAHPIQIDGTISAQTPNVPNWFSVSAQISAPGLFTILIASPVFYEPELTHVRIRAVSNNTLPRSLSAVLAGLWVGDTLWCQRPKDKYGI